MTSILSPALPSPFRALTHASAQAFDLVGLKEGDARRLQRPPSHPGVILAGDGSDSDYSSIIPKTRALWGLASRFRVFSTLFKGPSILAPRLDSSHRQS